MQGERRTPGINPPQDGPPSNVCKRNASSAGTNETAFRRIAFTPSTSGRRVRAYHSCLGESPMRYRLSPVFCRPWLLNGITPRLIESHYENNYGGALNRLNEIAEELAAVDPAKASAHAVSRLKKEEAATLNSTLLHELYFASLGGDGRMVPEEMSAAIGRDFGSVAGWRDEFIALAGALAEGSGWVLLTYVP